MKYLHKMTSYGKLFSDELIEWLLESGFIKSQWQMYIHYNYASDGTDIYVLSYFNDYVYWY